MENKISIIVPVYNVEKYVKRCIDSILNQTYKNLEVILINDGSTDKSGYICDMYAGNDDRIKVIHQINKGLSKARDRGIKESSGEYILFIDSDDWIECNALEILMNNVKYEDIDILIYGYKVEFIQKDNKKIEIVTSEEKYYKTVLDYLDDFDIYRTNGLFGYCWNKMYKADIIRKNKVFFGEYLFPEDLYFNFKVLPYCKNIKIINKSFYHYMHQSEITLSKVKKDEIIVMNQIYDNTVEFLKKMNSYENNKEYVSTKYIENIMSYILNEVFKSSHRINNMKNLYNNIRVKDSIKYFNSDITFYRFMYPFVRFNLPIMTLLYIYLYKGLKLNNR